MQKKFTVKPKRRIMASTNQDTARQVYEALKRAYEDDWSLEIDTPDLFAFYDDSGDGMSVIRFKDVAKVVNDNLDQAEAFLEDPYEVYEFQEDSGVDIHMYLSSVRAIQLFNKLGLEVPDYVYDDAEDDEFDW